MIFERSTNYSLLGSLLRDPGLYRFMADDFAPPVEEVTAAENEGLWYILARDGDGDLLGFYLFIPDSHIAWVFHTVMPLDARALIAMRELLGPDGWLWKHTPCLRANTYVPEHNKIALRFGMRAGLTVYGRDPRSYRKSGVLQDRILMGIGKDN